MYSDIPAWASALFVFGGLFALAWSSDRFVLGAAVLARRLGVSAFVVGMVIVGFGTSAPELLVSAFSGASGHTNLSLGNAYGSCVFNIAGILGVAALIRPLVVRPAIAFVASPLLVAVAGLSMFLLRDGELSRADALALLGVFALVMPLYCRFDKSDASDEGSGEGEDGAGMTTARAALWTLVGLGVMVGASHLLVWGAVDIARVLGVSELLIGLTIVSIGTSLPELASAIASARRGESELVLGNIVGSNLFNTLAVVGVAGVLSPARDFSRFVTVRDLPAMLLLSATILLFGANGRAFRATGRIPRALGAVWVLLFLAYLALTLWEEAVRS